MLNRIHTAKERKLLTALSNYYRASYNSRALGAVLSDVVAWGEDTQPTKAGILWEVFPPLSASKARNSLPLPTDLGVTWFVMM